MSRPAKLWEDRFHTNAAKVALQIKTTTEALCAEHGVLPAGLPESLVPTDILYELVTAYHAAHIMLVDYGLTKTGNLNSKNTKHILQ